MGPTGEHNLDRRFTGLSGGRLAMLMFRVEDRDRVAMGEITVTYRLWKYAHVKAGKTYPTGFGEAQIESVDLIPAALISQDDLHPAGCNSIEEVWRSAEHGNTVVTADSLLYRVQFRFLHG